MLKKVQAASGLLFAAFLSVHLLNTWVAAAGPGAYAALQRMLSFGYQAPVLEWLLLGAVLVHAGCAIGRWRTETRGRLPWRARLHRYAGVYLMIVIAGHVTATRIVPGMYGIRPGFEGVTFSLTLFPGFFYPYYLLLGVAGAYHALNGLAVAATRLGKPVTVSAPWLYAGAGTAAVLTLTALAAFGGHLFEVADPWQSDFAQLYLKLTGG